MPATPALFRRTAASAVGALLVTGLAACGGSGGTTATSGTTDTTSAAAQSAPASSGAGGASAGSPISSAEMKSLLHKGISSITTAHTTMSMDISAAGKSVQMSASGDVSMNPLAEALTMSFGGYSIEARYVGGAMYMKSPAFQAGDKWVEMTAQQMSTVTGGDMSSVLNNPLSVVDQMGDYITSSTFVGKESVGGVEASHYDMTVDLKSMAAKLGPTAQGAQAQLPSSAEEDLWFDAQGRIVKTVANLGPGQTVTVEMRDFGKKVDVQAPPAGQVKDMSSLHR